MFSFRCRSHVKEVILPKNMFGCPLKLILEFYGIFYVFGIQPKYSYKIMYECEKSPLTHELSYIGLFNFSHLSLFHVNVIVKSSSKKSWSLFFLFWYPNCECGPYMMVIAIIQTRAHTLKHECWILRHQPLLHWCHQL
jgi:hypothetical protein